MVILADGRSLAVSELGDPTGYPVVWCHGGLSSRVDVELGHAEITGLGIRVVTVDRPGIGGSTRHEDRRVADWPRDVEEVADELGLDRFAVAGWSAGGPFALACAALLPERVAAVATIGGMAPIRSRADSKQLGLAIDRMLIPLSRRIPWLAAGALQLGRRAKPARLKTRTLKTLPEPDRALLDPLPAEVAIGYTLAALRDGVHGTVDDYRAFGGPWGFELRHVRAPVRCWHGDADTLVPMEHARRLADSLPTGALTVVPNAGHFLFATHATEVFGGLFEDGKV
jgi:pimeloyl-ACP methyl ester carboxylesterase